MPAHRTWGLLAALSLALATGCGDDGGSLAGSPVSEPTTATAPNPTDPDSTDPDPTGPGATDSDSNGTDTTDPDTTGPDTTDDGSTSTPGGADGAEPAPSGTLADVSLALETVGRAEVPTAYRVHPDGTAFVTEKAGRVVSLDGAVAADVRDEVRDSGEQGLLGMAFSASGDELYLHYSDAATGGDTRVVAYPFAGGVADPARARVLLSVPQPFANHNGGDLHLGPDGHLWIGLGDGGSAGDPQEHGENPDTLLGSILRIDPDGPSDGGRAYAIPDDNPFVDGGGAAEVWLHGVRNPWRFSFDRANGDLWVADVGQNAWEEITVLAAADGRGRGADLGWDLREGTHRFEGDRPAGAIDPVFEYGHDEGCSITGGYVYRGNDIPALRGAYVFADLCRSTIRAIRARSDVIDAASYAVGVDGPISFGETSDGELVVLSRSGDVLRLVPGPA